MNIGALQYMNHLSIVPLHFEYIYIILENIVASGGLVVCVLAIVPKVREFDPGGGRWMFKGDKNP
jgi:hypothetical protein